LKVIKRKKVNNSHKMKSEINSFQDSDLFDIANLRKVAIWSMVFFGIIWLLAINLDRPVVQPIRNAWVLNGSGLASFPMWGYSILIRLLGSVTAVIVLQSLVAAFATAALMVRLNSLVPQLKRLNTLLFLFSLPWLSYMAYAYQMPMSSGFIILYMLALEMAIRSGKVTWGIVAGIFCGIGENFRSELFLLPGIVLLVVFVFKKLQKVTLPSIRPLVISVVVALIIQLPWALNCYFNASRFSFTESNLGHVAFLGLGKLESNPWHVVPSDGFAQETVNKAGLKCYSLSFEGGDFLKKTFIYNVKQDPLAYVECIGGRIWTSVYYPFGFVPLAVTSVEEHAAKEVVLMIKHPFINISKFLSNPLHDTSIIKVSGMLLYVISQGIIIRSISIFGIIGMYLAIRKGPFLWSSPIVLLLGILLLYRLGMNISLSDSGKYMTGVYLCYLPFAANTLWSIRLLFSSKKML